MRKLFFVLSIGALSSGLIGLSKSLWAANENNWFDLEYFNLIWRYWENNIGIKRIIASIPLSFALIYVAPKTFVVKLLQKPISVFACLTFASLPYIATFTQSSTENKPNVILITLDSVRLDYMGWGGSILQTTPKLDALAKKGVAFTQNISQSSWTKPSTATLITGVIPGKHRATGRFEPLRQSQLTLAEAFAEDGYRTRCYSSNPNITPAFGFKQGFDFMSHNTFANAESLVTQGKEWFFTKASKPTFLYLHLNDAHYPYTPPKPYAGKFNKTGVDAHLDGPAEREFRESLGATFSLEEIESLKLSYAEEILYLDDVVGDLVNEVLSKDKNTIVIITSDHGEEFLDHGDLGHGHTLYDELIRIPLQFQASDELIKKMSWVRGERHQQIRQIDVLPTIIDLCNLSWPVEKAPLDGLSLQSYLTETTPPSQERAAFSETDSFGSPISGLTGPLRSYRTEKEKLILTDPFTEKTAGRIWVFNLINDEQEQNNLAGIIKWDNLLKLLEVSGNLIQRDLSNVESVKLSDAQKAELAEMGYTDSEDPTEVDDEPYFDPRATPWFKIKTQADNR